MTYIEKTENRNDVTSTNRRCIRRVNSYIENIEGQLTSAPHNMLAPLDAQKYLVYAVEDIREYVEGLASGLYYIGEEYAVNNPLETDEDVRNYRHDLSLHSEIYRRLANVIDDAVQGARRDFNELTAK